MPRLHRRTRPETTKHCPQCNSTRLIYEAGLITGQKYHCLNCDYVGSFVIEVDQTDEEPPLPE